MTLKIAIIGAGPSGCCLARILTQSTASKALEITIFEGEASLNVRSQGGTLDLRQDTGLAAIRAANLMNEFNENARYEGDALTVTDKYFKKWLVLDSEKKKENVRAPEIDRFRLRQLLLDSLPEGIIRWGKRLAEVKTAADGTQELRFKDGTSAGGFDLVVGADGTWSKVRPAISKDVPAFSGVAGWAFTISSASTVCPDTVKTLNAGTLMAKHDRKFISIQQMGDDVIQAIIFFIPPNGDEKWLEKAAYDTTDVELARDWVLSELMADWAPELRQPWEMCSKQNAQLQPWTLFELPVGHNWTHVKGITIMGDAAHIMTPFAGEGVNQALTDAKVLGEAIVKAVSLNEGEKSASSLDGAVVEYEKEMFVRMAAKMENTRQMKEISMEDGGLYRNIEKWGYTAIADGLPAPWISKPIVATLIYGYFFFWRMWNRPKP